jgi:hypothetical protein
MTWNNIQSKGLSPDQASAHTPGKKRGKIFKVVPVNDSTYQVSWSASQVPNPSLRLVSKAKVKPLFYVEWGWGPWWLPCVGWAREREREIWVLGVFPLIWVWGKVKRGGKNLLFVFSNEQDPAWKFDDDEYFEMCVHESRRDKMHIYHLIPTSRKLFIFLTSSRSRREERESDLIATKIR